MARIVDSQAPPEEYAPTWFWSRYTRVANMNENPLALWLSGYGYGRSGIGRLPHPRSLYHYLPPFISVVVIAVWFLAAIDPVLANTAIVALVPVFIMARLISFTRLLRRETRSGRMVELYMAMNPPDLAMGLAGGYLLGSQFLHMIAGLSLSVLMITLTVSNHAINSPDQGVFILLNIWMLQYIIANDSVFTTMESIAAGTRLAGRPQYEISFKDWALEFLRALKLFLYRIGVPYLFSLQFLFFTVSARAVLTGGGQKAGSVAMFLCTLSLVMFVWLHGSICENLRAVIWSELEDRIDEEMADVINANPVSHSS